MSGGSEPIGAELLVLFRGAIESRAVAIKEGISPSDRYSSSSSTSSVCCVEVCVLSTGGVSVDRR